MHILISAHNQCIHFKHSTKSVASNIEGWEYSPRPIVGYRRNDNVKRLAQCWVDPIMSTCYIDNFFQKNVWKIRKTFKKARI